jgi:arylsulfatase A-like enzyme
VNIIVIVIDTLRYDYIGAHGNDWIKTPNMDRLAESAWVFTNSYTGSYPTIPHRTDAITGKYGDPFFPWRPLRHDHVTLPWTLAEAGYCTQLIHDTPHLVNGGHNFDWPFHCWTFVRGAEVDRPWIDDSEEWPANWALDPLFDSVEGDPSAHRMVATYARANRKRKEHEDWNCAKLFLRATEWLQDNTSRDRFFLWVDCFDPHEPWDVPPEFMLMYDDTPGYDGRIDPRGFVGRNQDGLPEAARKRVAARYAAKVSWVDHWLGKFLDTLESTDLADNTAVLLTADHGTNCGERGHFGKSYPVREQEAHTPFIVRIPGDSGGRSDIIVQPQDIFATVLGIAEVGVPKGIESYDVVAHAREGGESPRKLALSGRQASPQWNAGPNSVLFSAFDGEWALEVTAKPENCRLERMGTLQDVAAGNQDVVAELHAAALDEIERRGIDPRLMAWLRSEGEDDFPTESTFWDGYPGPAAFQPYFSRIYVEGQ